jgi:epoxyqueuosine reductase
LARAPTARRIDACPTGALSDDEPGVLDATRCLSYWTQTAGEMPDDVMDALEDRVYGCDICQDVCPWNRGVEKRRAEAPLPGDATPTVSLADWLEDDGEELVDDLERLYVPKNDPRWLRRNALVALGNGGGDRGLARPYVDDPDPALRAAAQRVLGRSADRLPEEVGRG